MMATRELRFRHSHLVERKIPCNYFVSTHFVETGDPFPHDLASGQSFRPNSISDIASMASNGITIGAHSHTHPDFGQEMSDHQLRTEIHDVRKKLQDWSQQPVYYFAFPFGLAKNITQRAIDYVFDDGFDCFVSAAGGHNWPGFDANHLQRVHGDPGMAAVANWLTLDPRNLVRNRRLSIIAITIRSARHFTNCLEFPLKQRGKVLTLQEPYETVRCILPKSANTLPGKTSMAGNTRRPSGARPLPAYQVHHY